MIPSETVPCETCGTPTPFTGTRRCNNCWEVERRLPDYLRSPKAWEFVRQHIPKLDDWVDGHPDAWDYDAVLRENKVIVEWCDTLVDGNGNEHRAGEFAGWGFHWTHGAIHIGRTTETIARKAAALFVSLWLQGVSASFCDKIMSGMIWFWELQEPPRQVNILSPLNLAKLFHETYERLAPSFGYQTRRETRRFQPGRVKAWEFAGKMIWCCLAVFVPLVVVLCCGLVALFSAVPWDVAWRWSNVDRRIVAVSQSDFQVGSLLSSES